MTEDDSWFDVLGTEAMQEGASTMRFPRVGFRRPRPGSLSPIGRLIVLVFVTVLVAVVLALIVQGSNRPRADRRFLHALSALASDSAQVGSSFARLAASGSSRGAGLESRLNALLVRQQHDLDALLALQVPPWLWDLRERAVGAFALRVSGLQGLVASAGSSASDAPASAQLFRQQVQRFLTSDVVWSDLVAEPERVEAERERFGGRVTVASSFLSSADREAPAMLAARLHDLSTVRRRASVPSAAVLKLGDRGVAVGNWQRRLNEWLRQRSPGQQPLVIDGVFGAGTQAITAQLQRSSGITVDGTVGPATRRALAAALSKKAPAG